MGLIKLKDAYNDDGRIHFLNTDKIIKFTLVNALDNESVDLTEITCGGLSYLNVKETPEQIAELFLQATQGDK